MRLAVLDHQRRCFQVRWARRAASEAVDLGSRAGRSDREQTAVLQQLADANALEDQLVSDEEALVPAAAALAAREVAGLPPP